MSGNRRLAPQESSAVGADFDCGLLGTVRWGVKVFELRFPCTLESGVGSHGGVTVG